MSLKVKDIENIIEEYAPLILKEDYDNVGLMVGDSQCEITSILVALDCTLEVIDEAIKKNCNFILTHHPLIFKRPSNITNDTLLGKKIIKLIKSDLNLYSSHTNLDSVKGGINDMLLDVLGFSNGQVIDPSKVNGYDDVKLGIGRIINLNDSISLLELCSKVKVALKTSHIRYVGDKTMEINKIAIINGSGESYFQQAISLGAQCIITGDTSYHYASDYRELGIAIIDAGHFGTEWPAFKLVFSILEKTIIDKGYNNSVFISESIKDPYSFM